MFADVHVHGVLFVITENWKWLKCLTTRNLSYKSWFIQIMKHRETIILYHRTVSNGMNIFTIFAPQNKVRFVGQHIQSDPKFISATKNSYRCIGKKVGKTYASDLIMFNFRYGGYR